MNAPTPAQAVPEAIVAAAASAVEADFRSLAPETAGRLAAWLRRGSIARAMSAAALSSGSFPAIALPLWMTPADRRAELSAFHLDVARSTLAGFLAIRLIDRVADGDGPPAVRPLLPAAGLLHHLFEAPYHRHFDAAHPFWPRFAALSGAHVDATVADASASDIDGEAFLAFSSRKYTATKVPITAVAMRLGRPGLAAPWCALVDLLGRSAQMENDFLGWRRDEAHGNATYLTSEARRRRRPGEDTAAWLVREGAGWCRAVATAWFDEAAAAAAGLDSPELTAWMTRRRRLLDLALDTRPAARPHLFGSAGPENPKGT